MNRDEMIHAADLLDEFSGVLRNIGDSSEANVASRLADKLRAAATSTTPTLPTPMPTVTHDCDGDDPCTCPPRGTGG